MKNIVILYKFLPHYRVEFYNLLREKLLKFDISLSVIYGNSNAKDALKKDEVIVPWAKYVPNQRFYIGKTELLWQPCLSIVRRYDLVIVQSENKLLLNYLLMFYRRFKGLKLAFWGHVYNMQQNHDSLRNRFKLHFIKYCDWWFAYTKGAGNYLIEHGFQKDRITVVQNAIDSLALMRHYDNIEEEFVTALRVELGIKSENVGIFCGGMYPEKDLDFVLETCMLVKKEIPDFHMLFIGAGIHASKVIAAAERNNWIHYLGPKLGMDRTSYFKIASIQLMPGLVGLCILDSFAMNTPIVTTDHDFHSPEIEYLENGVNGMMTKRDVVDYTRCIVDILINKKFKAMAVAGAVSAQKYTVEQMADNFARGVIAALAS